MDANDERDYEEEAYNRTLAAREALDELDAERLAYLETLPKELRAVDPIDLDDPVLTVTQALSIVFAYLSVDPVEVFHAILTDDDKKLRYHVADYALKELVLPILDCALETSRQKNDIMELLIRDQLVALGVREAD